MFVAILSVLFFLIDFFVKILVQKILIFNQPVVLIPKILWFRLVYNQGAAFGILQGKVLLLILIALFFIAGICWWLKKTDLTKKEKVFLSMIIGGASSNLWDRISLGYVVDYIDLGWWPVFNIADSLICVGCAAFVIMEFLKPKKSSE